MLMQLSADQEKALRKLYGWYRKNDGQYITLGGYAGTGKTTLLGILRRIIHSQDKGVKVAFASFTGKGALVLKNKLIDLAAVYKGDTVGTIHSLIYEPIENSNMEIVGWARKDEIKQDLIIIDEASMVNQEIWYDLLNYKKPIIAVGDHGQLPPISGSFNLVDKPHLKLEQIHRQVENNPIIQLSVMARTEGKIPPKRYGENIMKLLNNDWETSEFINDILNNFNEDTLVLCGYNATRVKINNQVRYNLGFEDPEPTIGDRVICLRNNHEKQIFNGMLGHVKHIEEIDTNWYSAKVDMESGVKYSGNIYKLQFNNPQPINFTKERKKLGNGDIFDFGYALTVHKAQGSEANRVVLFEERFSQMTEDEWKKWLYTGVTRAKEELYIIGN